MVRTTAFDKAETTGGKADVEACVATVAANSMSAFQSKNEVKSARPDLISARVVVSGAVVLRERVCGGG